LINSFLENIDKKENKMRKYSIVTITLLFTSLGFATDVDSLNLKSMYEGAKEVEMLNKAMERGMKEHNQPREPILIEETTQELIENTPMEGFQELNDKFYLERVIEESENTKVTVTTHGNMVKIKTNTTKKEYKPTSNGMSESSFSSSSTEELSLPQNSNINQLTQEYKDGILKIFVPKNK
jgi:HSP20 family molecular chaperone IbpA